MVDRPVDRLDHRRRQSGARHHADHDRERADAARQQRRDAEALFGGFGLALAFDGLQPVERVDRLRIGVVVRVGGFALDRAKGVEVVVVKRLEFRLDRLIDERGARLRDRLGELLFLVVGERALCVAAEFARRSLKHLVRRQQQIVGLLADAEKRLVAAEREPHLQQLLRTGLEVRHR